MYPSTLLVLLSLASLAASVFDEQLHAKYKTLPRDEFIEYFNSQQLSYNITHYEHLEGKHFNYAQFHDKNTLPILTHAPEAFSDLPENFDAREKWPHCDTIHDIYDQYNGTDGCGSCWTFGTATPMSDRMCIHLNKVVRLAEQDFECCDGCSDRDYGVCFGGNPIAALTFWVYTGLVTQACKPYNTYELRKNICNKTCVDRSRNYETDKHFGQNAYALSKKEEDIKRELFTNGPILAGMIVYEDFVKYKGGIYEHKFGQYKGAHFVRVIGYGVENGVKYWLGANSWTSTWGEKGFFRTKRYQIEVDFEEEMLAGIPKN